MEWPSPPDDESSARQAVFQAQLSDEQAARDHERKQAAAVAERDWQRVKLTLESEQLLRRQVHQARLEVAKTAIDRARRAAEFVRIAASALVTLYTAVIGASFAVTKTALPNRGLVPVVFLGAAVVFSAGYVAYATRPRDTPDLIPTSDLLERERRRMNAFVDWANELAMRRLYALQVSVLSLGFGLFFLPAPFIRWGNLVVWALAAGAALVALGLPVLTARRARPDLDRL